MTPARALLMAMCIALGGTANAQPAASPDPDVVAIRSVFELGNYEQALSRARERIDRGGLPESQTLELHKIAGLSAFNLGQQADAERHLGAVLRLDPDFTLDPFVVSPPAIQLFEKVRKDLGPTLDAIRQLKRMQAEQRAKEAEEAERKRKAEEDERRRLEAMAAAAAARTIERRGFVVNFVPFGAGQFQQKRYGMGIGLAVSEGLLALTSVIGYWAYNGLIDERPVTLEDRGGKVITERGIPRSQEREKTVFQWMQLGGGAAFWSVYAFGVADAIYHHEGEVLVESRPQPSARLHLLPVTGGAGAALTLKF